MDGKAEIAMGKCIQKLIKEEGVGREDLVVSTKIFWGSPKQQNVNRRGLSRKHILEGTKLALQRLGLEYVDLIFAHRPDPDTPLEETVRAFDYVINKGQALYWGTSEWSADQIVEAIGIANKLGLIGPTMEQPQYSLLHRTRVEVEYSRLYRDHGLGTTIWSPLASGLLTGKYRSSTTFPEGTRLSLDSHKTLREQLQSGDGLNGLETKDFDAILKKVDALAPIAEKLGCSLAQLAIAWCAINPRVSTVITGASRAEQVAENFASLLVIPKLTKEIMEEIEKAVATKPKSVKNFR